MSVVKERTPNTCCRTKNYGNRYLKKQFHVDRDISNDKNNHLQCFYQVLLSAWYRDDTI